MTKESAFVVLRRNLRAVEEEIESKNKVIFLLRDCLEEALEDCVKERQRLVDLHGKSDPKGFVFVQDEFICKCQSAIDESNKALPSAS